MKIIFLLLLCFILTGFCSGCKYQNTCSDGNIHTYNLLRFSDNAFNPYWHNVPPIISIYELLAFDEYEAMFRGKILDVSKVGLLLYHKQEDTAWEVEIPIEISSDFEGSGGSLCILYNCYNGYDNE